MTSHPLRHLYLSLILVLAGGCLAYWIQTDGGTITVRDVRFAGTNGTMMSGLLYIPEGVSNEQPAPGILAVHGYINSRETQDGFAIEFARRGYVVLALDQTGHGFSDPPAFANGYGGPDGLKYLRSLDIVDKANIGLEGHSMGGWAVLIAAATYPDDYKSIAIVGSSTGTAGAPEGTATSPRNLGVIFSIWDEFSGLMWGAEVPAEIVKTEKLKNVFGADGPVEIERLYGSVSEGTARMLYMPSVTHPGDHLSTEAIGQAVDWMQRTLTGGNGLPPENQTWYWKESGTLLALIGAVWFLFPLGVLLLRSGPFQRLAEPLPESRAITGPGWWGSAAMMFVVPVVTYYWLNHLGSDLFPVNAFWPQSITTGIMTWAMGNALITLIGLLLWHHLSNQKKGATSENYGMTRDLKVIGRSFCLAICIILPVYLLLAFYDGLFTIDFRFWVLAVKPMSARHFGTFLAYLPPFVVFFLVIGISLHGQLRSGILTNIILLAGGFVALLLVQYIPLLLGGTLPLREPLLTIVAFQVVPLLTIVALISTFFFRITGRIYTGAFINALFITWVIVAGQATQYGGP